MINPLREFPEKFRTHKRSEELSRLVRSITEHEAMKVSKPHVRDNMLRASTAFTTCFYGNLCATLEHYMSSMHKGSRLAAKKNTQMLHLLLDLATGELATKNIPTHDDNHCPHYVPMKEAANASGIDTSALEHFVEAIDSKGADVLYECEQAGFNNELTEYFIYSDACSEKFEDAFATIALRELTLSDNFHVIVNSLPNDRAYDDWRVFLNAHIELDEEEHGPLMAQALESIQDVDRAINTMIEFYTRRKAVYDSCLDENPIW